MITRVATHLMFAGAAADAIELYSRTFSEFTVLSLRKSEAATVGGGDTVQYAEAMLAGHRLSFTDSPATHDFTFTPSTSLFIDVDSEEELARCFGLLSEDGKVLMPVNNYGFSKLFGWCNDKFGVSWQLNLP